MTLLDLVQLVAPRVRPGCEIAVLVPASDGRLLSDSVFRTLEQYPGPAGAAVRAVSMFCGPHLCITYTTTQADSGRVVSSTGGVAPW